MQNSHYTIKTMTREMIPIAIDWAALEGWNPGLYDAESFYAADPMGFFVGEVVGEPVSTISAVKYGEGFGFIGFYIVKPAYRSQGYGIPIWNAALRYLAGRNIGLDGVVAQQENYQKSGFKLAYRNIRYQGLTSSYPQGQSAIVPLSEVPFAEILAYDRPLFPEPRSRFLQAWLNQPESVALGIVHQGKLAGYGMIRVCRSGYKIGPLFADTPAFAEDLFLALQSRVKPGQPLYLDTPETNPDAIAIAQKYDLQRVFETARMYTGSFPDLTFQKLFGVTSFELG